MNHPRPASPRHEPHRRLPQAADSDTNAVRASPAAIDRLLAARAKSGDAAAFNDLVARYEARLFNFLRRRVGSDADAEDLAQEAFIRAWLRIEQYDPRWCFSTWIMAIAANLAIAAHRRARPASPLPPEDPAAAAHDPAVAMDTREQCRRLWDAADAILSEPQRLALWLRHAEGMTVAQIADALSRSPIAVRVSLFRARAALAKHLSPAPSDPAATSPPASPAADETDSEAGRPHAASPSHRPRNANPAPLAPSITAATRSRSRAPNPLSEGLAP